MFIILSYTEIRILGRWLTYSQVNVKNIADQTVLHYAAMWPDMPVDLFKEILDKSDNANAEDDKRDRPLHWALQNQSTGAAHQLLHLESVDVI